ncbi:hypothetical protein HG537_0D06210 [Torulaspora globosa]|uniref:Uncharacterized protein n=1 Tax=Torulaspora globosa TaxID=48254 RepID=A0A7H9HTD8_9SACH|nr:hypothetical protein HG537_0D06210 [Torulaspora sp. CBS 2947]
MCCCTVSDIILYIIAFFVPPVAVMLRAGLCSSDFLLNLLLTLLGFLPGMVHAFYYIAITSPLRRDTEYAYFYQQGWIDHERQTPRNGPRQEPIANASHSEQTPLLEGAPVTHVPHTGGKMEPSAPPPYAELP